ncbi:MAG: shikimate kinase [Fuerstiella sp.]|nr:shikimate kinase [Fuerstiella sp.]
MVITLIGYRGSGKSVVAGLLADMLDLSSIDSDDVIEARAGRSIAEIFAQDGEPEFRRIEQDVIRDLTGQDALIIAAGGGAILDLQNRQRMKESGPVVWLQASVPQLARRIRQDQSTANRRPSLTGQSVEDEIETVLTVRFPLYADASTIRINTDGLSPDQVATEIRSQLSAEGRCS